MAVVIVVDPLFDKVFVSPCLLAKIGRKRARRFEAILLQHFRASADHNFALARETILFLKVINEILL